MRHHLYRVIGATALVLAIGSTAAGMPSSAQEPPPPIAVEILTPRSEFTDDVAIRVKLKLTGERRSSRTTINMDAPSRTVVARITVQPGAHFPWHTHHGPVIVNVSSGALVYVMADDCLERPYAAGTVFVDPGRGNVHTAFNPSAEATVLYATFFEAPASGPLTITEGIEAPDDCAVEAGDHAGH